jgi:hypothetical protein
MIILKNQKVICILTPEVRTYKNAIAILNSEPNGSSEMREGIDTYKFSCQLEIPRCFYYSLALSHDSLQGRCLEAILSTLLNRVKSKQNLVVPHPFLENGPWAHSTLKMKCALSVCRFCVKGAPGSVQGECKQISEEISWLSSFRACCNWPRLKEFSKLYLGQGKCRCFPETGVQGR